jgi:gliding motility-associated-like protein
MWKLFCVAAAALLFSNVVNAQSITYAGSFCAGEQITLTATNPPAGIIQWQFATSLAGPYTNTGGNTITLIVNTPGFYTASVNTVPVTRFDTVQVTQNPKPVANFSFTANNSCSGTSVPFTSNITNGTAPFVYAWDFGDGNTSNVANPSHVFASLGCASANFNVRLIVTDSKGCKDTITKPVTVLQRPDVNIADQDIFSPFSNCDNNPTPGNPNFTLVVNNVSPGASCITSYTINWGDGNTQTNVTFPASHTYTQLGAFNLAVTGFGSNGCNSTRTYVVGNQSNPAGGLATLGATTGLCVPSTIPFVITNWENNSPGTVYELDFGDGVIQTLTHPLNATNTAHTINHQYLTSSCPQPTYTATLTVINACDKTPYTAGNIQIRMKPQASFTVQPNPGCVNQSICFTNTTTAGSTGPTCLATTAYSWDFGDPASGTNNTSTLQSPCHTFSAPGTYTVTLTSSNPCGPSTATRVVCITAPPTPAFTIDNSIGCIPLPVIVTNTTNTTGNCAPTTWLWTVSYSATNCGTGAGWAFTNSTNNTSQNPQFIFNNPGTYTIQLAATNACGTFTTTRTVTVKQPPTVSLPSFATTCGTATINPVATITNCGTSTLSYAWSFPGGTPASSTLANPGTILYNTPGTHTVSLAVTNECGTTTVTRSITVNPVPVIAVPAPTSLCAGEQAGPFNFSSTPAGATFTWTNNNTSIGLAASGSGNIPAFTANNPGSTPLTVVITVTGSNGLCSAQQTFAITVNPRPAAPVVTTPVSYCLNDVATALSATATGGNTLLWYTVPSGGTGTAIAPTPSTGSIGTVSYYVSQVNLVSTCESQRSLINVIVRPIPSIGGVTSVNPSNCGSTNGSFTLTGLNASTSYTVHYLANGNPQTQTMTSSAAGTIQIPGLPAGSYTNIYVTLNGCNSAQAGPVQLTNPAQPATPVIPNVPQMCSGGTLSLSATSSTPGVTYNWTGPNGFTSPLSNPTITGVTVAASGTYFVTATINGCTSPAASVSVVINPTPALPVAVSNSPVCEGNNLTLSASTSTAGSITWAWTGPDAFGSTQQNPVINNATIAASGSYQVIATATTNGQSCPAAPVSVAVIVHPLPHIIDSSFTHPTQCGVANGTIILKGLITGTTYTVQYDFNTNPVTIAIAATAGGVVTISNLAPGIYSNIRVTANGCVSNIAGPFTLSNPTPPNTPVIVSNSPICSGNSITLTATTSSAGSVTYSWTGPGGFTSAIPNPSIPNATVANSGIYQVIATIAGCTSAPATVNVVVNQTPVTPVVSSNSPVCTGNNLQLNSGTSTPGGMSYAWTGPNSFTSNLQNPVVNNITTAGAGMYTVIYTSTGPGACVSAAANTIVVVNSTPVLTTAVPSDPTACGSITGSITLQGLTAGQVYTVNYNYNTLPQSATITANATGNVVITGLTQGTYTNITVQLLGCVSNSLGPVTLTDPNPPSPPVASSNSAICSGQTLNLSAASTAPGTVSYTWSGPNGFNSTQQNPSITTASASNAGYYYVYVTINNCNSLRDSVLVVINPLGALPAVTTPIAYCIGQPSVALTATPASGGTLNWYNVASGGTPLSSAPVPSTAVAGTTSYYVSQSTAAGCEGSRAQINVVINPDAKAVFNPTATIKCAPFVIGNADIGLQAFPANNGIYNWYADNVFIGAGTNFPGHTITQPDDSVTIKLVAISAFGCKSDSMEAKFYTYKVPSPSFTLSDTVGCGPLSVIFTNTTPGINLYNYYWDFGNGQTSTAQQPGTIIFPINPTYNDTTYKVKLKIETLCDTITFEKTVRVQAPPRALFIPDRTTGCSPMRVVFANTSLGLNSTYYWNFGDGSTFVTTSKAPVTHVYNSPVVDTFQVQLIAVNECGSDTQHFELRIAPNNIQLNFNVNGTQNFGCSPHTVAFINNSAGASSFEWNFGDGNTLSTTDNIDTVYHTFTTPGTYNVTLMAINSCTDTIATRSITVYPKPVAAFISNSYTVCIGQSIQLTNQSSAANTYAWNFGDGITSVLINPSHTYASPGLYTIRLVSFRNNPSGDVCVDTAYQQILVKDTLTGWFTMSDSVSSCAPLKVTFVNKVRPSVTASWNFGDGNTAQGDSVVHTYTLPGIYYVDLIVKVPGGCIYQTRDTVTISGPSGNLVYNGGYSCVPTVSFTANAFNAAGYTWNFGDGNTQATTSNSVSHTYANPGRYVPSVTLQGSGSCTFPIQGLDTIKIDKLVAGFRYTSQQICGSTRVQFTDTSSAFFGLANTAWRFGDGSTGSGTSVAHTYTTTGLYNVEITITSISGCTRTIQVPVNVQVNSIPVASIIGDIEKCANQNVTFSANVISTDAVTIQQWALSNGVTANGPAFSYLFNIPGTYNLRYIAGTQQGCFDTAFHSIVIRPVPVVNATASTTICLGNSVQLNATGSPAYQWDPSVGLSCSTCPNPIATPVVTTPYIVTGSNAFGCAAYDTVVITVIQPMNLTVNPDVNICIGQSANLLASGAARYAWTPGATLSSTTVSNPIATPTATTRYRVVGYDGFNCFTDTAFVLVGVGKYPTVNLGPDLTLSTGTIHPLNSTVTNGPITQWLWQPSADLNCNNCPVPLATIKKDITYTVKVTTAYGCSATDSLNIKTFCENSQVFIPNAFTPDGDGVNDILMVRGKGIVTVKFFRIFNRWGELVFERTSFPPNVASYGWNGKIKGIVGGPDVFVFTAEVVCENGTSFVYKGNTSIIK